MPHVVFSMNLVVIASVLLHSKRRPTCSMSNSYTHIAQGPELSVDDRVMRSCCGDMAVLSVAIASH